MTATEYANRPAFYRPFSKAQMEAQYAKNAAGLRTMLQKAEQTGRKAGGFTADQLRERLQTFERLAQTCAS